MLDVFTFSSNLSASSMLQPRFMSENSLPCRLCNAECDTNASVTYHRPELLMLQRAVLDTKPLANPSAIMSSVSTHVWLPNTCISDKSPSMITIGTSEDSDGSRRFDAGSVSKTQLQSVKQLTLLATHLSTSALITHLLWLSDCASVWW